MKQLINPSVLNLKYAFFITTESEAISSLSEAYKRIYENHPVVTGFVGEDSEFAGRASEGAEIYIVRAKTDAGESQSGGWWGKAKPETQKPKLSNFEEETDFDGTIHLDYYIEECLLTIQIFDEENGFPISDNIMLVKYLSEISTTGEK